MNFCTDNWFFILYLSGIFSESNDWRKIEIAVLLWNRSYCDSIGCKEICTEIAKIQQIKKMYQKRVQNVAAWTQLSIVFLRDTPDHLNEREWEREKDKMEKWICTYAHSNDRSSLWYMFTWTISNWMRFRAHAIESLIHTHRRILILRPYIISWHTHIHFNFIFTYAISLHKVWDFPMHCSSFFPFPFSSAILTLVTIYYESKQNERNLMQSTNVRGNFFINDFSTV